MRALRPVGASVQTASLTLPWQNVRGSELSKRDCGLGGAGYGVGGAKGPPMAQLKHVRVRPSVAAVLNRESTPTPTRLVMFVLCMLAAFLCLCFGFKFPESPWEMAFLKHAGTTTSKMRPSSPQSCVRFESI